MNSKETIPPPQNIDPKDLPAHVAIIMDGNGRWAKKRMLNRLRGHERGVETVRTIVRTSREIGISFLTLYAFSTENWRRTQTEVSGLMRILDRFLKSELTEMMENNIRFSTIGQTEKLPDYVKNSIRRVLAETRDNSGMVLNLALSYGGRAEIVNMVQKIAQKAIDRELDIAAITEDTVSDYLETKDMPDPDLLIRTSGEMRISNFLLWQIAYSELYITKTLWPDFTKEEYLEILKEYRYRERRFGKA